MSDLRLDEADELLAAWVGARAESHGIRVLVIKGRPLADDGLRTARVSSDVDVLVDPARFEEYCAVVLAAGWQEFPSTYAAAHFTVHSRTLRKPGWPNSLDVHSDFPGFLREPDVTFEALWATRRDTAFAHRTCPVPSRAGNALILALHSLRGTHRQPRHAAEYAYLQRATFTSVERRELADLAAATGAADPLRDLLTSWGVDVDPAPLLRNTPRGREWHRKVAESHGAAASWLVLLSTAPWHEKPEVVRRAVWPSRADFRLQHPEVPDRLWPMLCARAARWGRGMARLGPAIRALGRR